MAITLSASVRAPVDALSHKYTGEDFPEEGPAKVRVTPTRVTGNAA